jgi:hypothetical protein
VGGEGRSSFPVWAGDPLNRNPQPFPGVIVISRKFRDNVPKRRKIWLLGRQISRNFLDICLIWGRYLDEKLRSSGKFPDI